MDIGNLQVAWAHIPDPTAVRDGITSMLCSVLNMGCLS
jgi:hypothetical protein